MAMPLAERLRPQRLSEFLGQESLTGPGGMLTRLIAASADTGFFPSILLWGPPGCGKTTLARIVARETRRRLFEFSAVNASVKDIEKAAQAGNAETAAQLTIGTENDDTSSPPIVFIDEIHRFSKSQQDSLLPHVERGTITLVGATTENPSFSVIAALLSRCRVLTLHQLEEEELHVLLKRAQELHPATIDDDAQAYLLQSSNGDARTLLNIYHIAWQLAGDEAITLEEVRQAIQKPQLAFDRSGEEFYNTISAFHKSIRGSDPDAALYYLARMLEAGQDPLYVARRMVRIASEDIGLMEPQALPLAVSALTSVEKMGMPECNLALAEVAVYLARAPKSNALYLAYMEAAKDVHGFGNLPIPLHIRNAASKLMKAQGYGEGYDYSHSKEGEKKEGVEYFPAKLAGKKYFR